MFVYMQMFLIVEGVLQFHQLSVFMCPRIAGTAVRPWMWMDVKKKRAAEHEDYCQYDIHQRDADRY